MFLNTLTKKNRSQLQNNNFFCSGIINLLFDGLAYNTSGHFAHCSEKATKHAKYPLVLYAKASNKVYIQEEISKIFGIFSRNNLLLAVV